MLNEARYVQNGASQNHVLLIVSATYFRLLIPYLSSKIVHYKQQSTWLPSVICNDFIHRETVSPVRF